MKQQRKWKHVYKEEDEMKNVFKKEDLKAKQISFEVKKNDNLCNFQKNTKLVKRNNNN